ncbi:MAG: ATP-binding protein [Actinomycetales bacterium]
MTTATTAGPGPVGERFSPARHWSQWRRSLRGRLALLVAASVGLAIALVAVLAWSVVRVQLFRSLDTSLLQRAQAAVSTALGDPQRIVALPSDALLAAGDVRILLVSASGTAYAAPGANVAPFGRAEVAVAAGARQQSVRTLARDGEQFRVVAVPAAQRFALVLAAPLQQTQHALRVVGLVLLVIVALGMAVAASAGVVVARAALRPVEGLTDAAERVARTGDLTPIEVAGDDEVARLTRTFNAMLTALAASQSRQRQLVADAGHELRTPLTSLRTNLDLLAQSEGSDRLPPEERRALLHDVRAQVGELSALVTDLVELARDDRRLADDDVDLADVLDRALTRVRPRANTGEGAPVEVTASVEPWWVRGDAAMLERAVLNLLDNAVKWSPPGGQVHVTLRHGTLRVADQGPGIADADLPRVFDRFYRSSEARAMPGSGLGLAIVRQTAELHGGQVSAGRTVSGGALLTLSLPGHPAPPAL